MNKFRSNMAEMFGINAAVIAEYLYVRDAKLIELEFNGRDWCRCSAKQITADNPYLTIPMVRYASGILRDKGVVISRQISKSEFDSTNWYAFTEYGESLMEGGFADGKRDQ